MKRTIRKGIAAVMSLIMMLSAAPEITMEQTAAEAAAAPVPAFPGAVGGGSLATGGRGGEVVHVTNLNDSGAGSFREAVSGSNKIVVFDVSGTIELKKDVVVGSNITIAGQTAPGGAGITLKNYKLGLGGENCIVRFVSSRPGERGTSADYDAFGGANGTNSIVDHCSIGWANDEQWGLYSKCDNLTVQYSVIGPSNSFSYHSKGIHGFGVMLGRANVTWDHNLIVHNVSRNYRGKVTDENASDFTNNIIYNWGYQTAYGTIAHVNYVGNTLKLGPSTAGGTHYIQVSNSDKFKVFLEGNRILNKDDSLRSGYDNNWTAMKFKSGKSQANTKADEHFPVMSNGIDVSSVLTIESAEDAYDHVIAHAGNGITSDTRTAIDQQVAYETKTGTGSLTGARPYSEASSSQKSTIDKYKIQCGVVYKYPDPVLEKTIIDNDNDGMADDWELARGLNPNDPADTNGDYCGEGYTNIEYYINDLTVDAFPEGVVTPSPELKPVSAFEQIEAENFSGQSGVVAEDCSEGGKNIGYIENGDYIMFRGVDFGDGANSFKARIASSETGGNIELYLDKLDGTLVGKSAVSGSGGWQDWTDVSFNTDKITGRHTLYLKFTGGEGFLMNINHFVFSRESLPMDGKLVKNLIVKDTANISGWKLAENFAVGSLVFGDRPVTCAEMPDELLGAEIIMTACDSKSFTGSLAEFTAGADITVYTCIDARVAACPEWLSSWEESGMTYLGSNGVTFVLYKKDFRSGETITLGENGQSGGCVGYTVLVKKTGTAEPPVTTTTAVTTTVTTTETTTSTVTVPVSIIGDVNADNTFGIIDIVAMQKYLLCIGTLEDASSGDMNADGRINVIDLTLMKIMLHNQ